MEAIMSRKIKHFEEMPSFRGFEASRPAII
jgi:hypothetical protein